VQPPSQPCQLLPDDSRYGFYPPTPAQQVVTPSEPQLGSGHPPLHPLYRSPQLRHSQTPPQQLVPLNSLELNNEEDDEETSYSEPEIDEQSDDEDERQAHALLHAAPGQVTVPVSQPQLPAVHGIDVTAIPQLLPPTNQGHPGFAVSTISLSEFAQFHGAIGTRY